MALTQLDVQERRPYGTFGGVDFQLNRGVAYFELDPNAGECASIVDMQSAPTNARGLVAFDSDFYLIEPNGDKSKLLVEIPNRGRTLAFRMFNRAGIHTLQDPVAAGDGFIFEQGFALLSIGWQWDITQAGLGFRAPRLAGAVGEVTARIRPNRTTPYCHFGQLGEVAYPPRDLNDPDARLFRREHPNANYELIPRDRWRFAKVRDNAVQPSDSHLWLQDGFEAGVFYTVVYNAEDPAVAGAGLLAIREAAGYARSDLGYQHLYAFGASQTGRVLRHFLHLGLNNTVDTANEGVVFDGVLPHIAGAQRGDFNHRFAQPSALGAPSFGQTPPFGSLAECSPRAKVMITNTSWEYWRGDAALAHISSTQSRDLATPANARVYAFAGTHHINGILPLSRKMVETGERAQLSFNVVDYAPLLRAALTNLDLWCRLNKSPPPSAHPRLDDGTAITRSTVLENTGAQPSLHPSKLSHMRRLNLHLDEHSQPHYPAEELEAYTAFVSAVDNDGNEVAGIRLPDISVPVATHTGWNPRHPDTGAPDQAAIFVGFTRFFSPDEIQRRYPTRQNYASLVRAAAESLRESGFLLPQDIEMVVANALARFDLALADATDTPGPDDNL